jgi:flagellar hook-associated protein 3 FlgL
VKTAFVSSSAISEAMRYQTMRLQSDLLKAQTEANSGAYADVGLELGGRTGQAVSFTRDMDRLETIASANAVAKSRLAASQAALGQVGSAAQSFLSTLTSATAGDAGPTVTLGSANAAFQSLHDVMNTSLNGEYIFSGVDTDVQPLSDFADPGSTARAAFEAAFQNHFGFSPTDAQAAALDAAAINGFIDGPASDLFLGSGWNGTMSAASDQEIISRITTTETAPTSITANTDGVRKLAMASALVMGLFSGNLGEGAREAVVGRAIGLVGDSIAGLTATQADAGITEQRIAKANERLTTQVALFKTSLQDLQGVDPYEAANRVNTLLTQIETSYALTARIHQLSLLNYL